jgi:cobalt-zinc-cadmium efflux system membrane fusion protein
MNGLRKVASLLTLTWLLSMSTLSAMAVGVATENEAEPEKGPHSGLMLRDEDFSVELAIFETGVPPEYRAWVTDGGQAVAPEAVNLQVVLTRLGDVRDEIKFAPQGDFLRGDMEIYEPHSFTVSVFAHYEGNDYRWQYDSFEGRTAIEQEVANAMGIITEIAGPATLHETITAYGKLILPPAGQSTLRARFEGQIVEVHKRLGDAVKKGDALITIENNESLRAYTLRAPMTGIISALDGAVGEQTENRVLAKIVDLSQTQAELSLFPLDRQRAFVGAAVTLRQAGINKPVTGTVVFIEPLVAPGQTQTARVDVQKLPIGWLPGQFISASIEVAIHPVSLAVKRTALQGFRDFTVVFAKVGEQYEVRMLELGREDSEWVEVLGGLKPSTEYVSENSYLLKADVEKSGASHDH